MPAVLKRTRDHNAPGEAKQSDRAAMLHQLLAGVVRAAGAGIAAGMVLLAIFIAVERRARGQAMIPLRYFGDPCFSSLNLMTFLLYGAFGSALLLLSYVLIAAGGYSPVEAGLAMLPISIILTVGSPVMGKLATRIGPRLPLTIGSLVVAAGLLLGMRIAADQDYWTGVLPAVATIACGMAIFVAPLTSSVLVSVEPEHTGMVSGFNSALSRAGGLIGVALLGAVLVNEGRALLGPFAVAMAICAIVSAISGATAFIGLRDYQPRKSKAASAA